MKTTQYIAGSTGTFGNTAKMSITLPEPPWGSVEVDDRRDTAPRAPMIRDASFKLKYDKGLSIAGYAGIKSDERGLKKDYDAATDLVDMLRA